MFLRSTFMSDYLNYNMDNYEKYFKKNNISYAYNSGYPEYISSRDINWVYFLPDYGLVFDHLKRLSYNETKELELNNYEVIGEFNQVKERIYGISSK